MTAIIATPILKMPKSRHSILNIYGESGTAGTRGMLEIRTQIKVEGKNVHENKKIEDGHRWEAS